MLLICKPFNVNSLKRLPQSQCILFIMNNLSLAWAIILLCSRFNKWNFIQVINLNESESWELFHPQNLGCERFISSEVCLNGNWKFADVEIVRDLECICGERKTGAYPEIFFMKWNFLGGFGIIFSKILAIRRNFLKR